MNKNIFIIISFLVIVVFSCKTKEKIIKQDSGNIRTEEELEKIIFNGNNEIKTIKYGKINFVININEDHYESGGNIAIIKDSIIIVSIAPFMGYEIARIFCLKEKILILDRQNKTYHFTPYNRNIGKFYVQGDYNTIESILTGRAFIYEKEKNDNSLKMNIIKEGDYLKYYFEMKEEELIKSKQEIRIRKDILKAESNHIKDSRNNLEISIDYDHPESINYNGLPDKINIHINNSEDIIDVNVNVGTIIVNEEVNANIVIPEKYQEIVMDY